MAGKGGWCVELDMKTRSWRYLRWGGRGRAEIHAAGPDGMAEVQRQCRIRVNLVFSPEQLYLLTDEFSDSKAELLALEIQQVFADRGLAIDGGSFSHRSKKLHSQGADRGMYQALFVSDQVLEELYAIAASWRWIRTMRIVPDIAAIAALVATATPDPVLVLHLDKHSSQIFAVRQGIPLYHQPLAHSGQDGPDIDLIPHAVEFAGQTLKREHDIDHCSLVVMGRNRAILEGKEIGLETTELQFSGKILPGDPELLYLHPQLFGAPLADPAYDFTPPTFYRSWRLQCFSRMLTLLAILGTAGCLAGWYQLRDDLGRLRNEYASLSRKVSTERRSLLSILPDDEKFSYFERLAAIRTHAARDHRLDTLIRNIALAIPPDVHISRLDVKREQEEHGGVSAPTAPPLAVPVQPALVPGVEPSASAPTQAARSGPEKLQDSPLLISLTFTTGGSYGETTQRFDQTVQALASMYSINDVTREYAEEKLSGTLHCKLKPLSEEID